MIYFSILFLSSFIFPLSITKGKATSQISVPYIILIIPHTFFQKEKFLYLLALFIIVCSTFCGESFAQTTNVNGYNLELFHPSCDGKGIISVNGSDVLEHLKLHLGFFTNVNRGLLTASNAANNRSVNIVDTFVMGDFLFGMGLWNFLEFGIDLPVAFYERGRDFNTAKVFDTTGIGDIRFDLKFNLLKDKHLMPGIAFLSSFYFPSGETSKFTGSNKVEYKAQLIADKKFRRFYLTANVGYKVVPQKKVINIDHDDELIFGAGAAVPLPVWNRSLELIGEIYGSTVIKDVKEITTPIELMGGIRKTFNDNLTLTIGGGAGLTNGAGSPAWRALVGLGYSFGGRKEKISNEQGLELINQIIYFDFASEKIRKSDIEALVKIGKILSTDPNRSVLISGHTDSTGPKLFNQHLSKERAKAVKNLLITNNVYPDQITIEAFGEEKPIASNVTRDGRAKNRRCEINEILNE